MFDWTARLAIIGCMLGTLSGCARIGPFSPIAPLERSLVFQGVPYPRGNWQPAGVAFEDAWFEAEDGTPLHGWFLPHARPRGIALYCHGNAGNVTHRADVLRTLRDDFGLSVMTFDYRGYGRSVGKPNEQGILMDAQAARAWLAERTGVEERDILVIGRSLGGAVAVHLAANGGARGLVLASTFTSLPDVARHQFPWLPAKLMMSNRLNSMNAIADYHGPLLQCHGDADRVVPYALGKELFDAAPGPKGFVTIEGGGHNDPWDHTFLAALDQFLTQIQAGAASPDGEPSGTPHALVHEKLGGPVWAE